MAGTSGLGKALGIVALIIAILAIFIPLFSLYVVLIALMLATFGLFFRDRTISIAAWIVCAVNVAFLSPLTWVLFAAEMAGGGYTLITLATVGFLAPIAAFILRVVLDGRARQAEQAQNVPQAAYPTTRLQGDPATPWQGGHGVDERGRRAAAYPPTSTAPYRAERHPEFTRPAPSPVPAPAPASHPVAPPGGRLLKCPKCATTVAVAAGAKPSCPSCGHGSPAIAEGTPPPQPTMQEPEEEPIRETAPMPVAVSPQPEIFVMEPTGAPHRPPFQADARPKATAEEPAPYAASTRPSPRTTSRPPVETRGMAGAPPYNGFEAKSLLFMGPVLNAVGRGRVFSRSCAIALWLAAAMVVMVGIVGWVEAWKLVDLFQGAEVAGLIIFQAFFLLAIYMVSHTLIIRGRDINALQGGEFTVIPIWSILLKMTGELYASAASAIAVGGGVLMWTMSGFGAGALLPAFLPLPGAGGSGFVAGLVFMLAGLLVAGLVLLFFYFVAEVVVVTVEIAKNSAAIRKIAEEHERRAPPAGDAATWPMPSAEQHLA